MDPTSPIAIEIAAIRARIAKADEADAAAAAAIAAARLDPETVDARTQVLIARGKQVAPQGEPWEDYREWPYLHRLEQID